MNETAQADYQVNGHEFVITERYESQDSELIQCRGCLHVEVLDDDDDPEDHLELRTDECHIEWLREPEGRSHGIALRNASYFRGRELIGVREGGKLGEGEVVDKVRVYDDDAGRLASLLDKQTWKEVLA